MAGITSLFDSAVQCWGCPVFDHLFDVINSAATAMYNDMSRLAIVLLCCFIAFYAIYAFVDALITKNAPGDLWSKYIKPVGINTIVIVGVLGAGLIFPRIITRVTLEPVTDLALIYETAVVGNGGNSVSGSGSVSVSVSVGDNDAGFYRPELRDKIHALMQSSTTVFQNMIHLGLSVMDGAFSWSAITGIGKLVRHIIMFLIGFAIVFGFFKLFIKFCFYFVDVIVALTMFAFFFPLGLLSFVFQNSSAPAWIKKYGENIAPGMLKNAINAIVKLATVIITYVVIMILITRFFAANNASGTDIAGQLLSGAAIDGDLLSDDNVAAMSLSAMLVLMYVVSFISDQIPGVAKMITDTFNIGGPATQLGDELGDDAIKISGNILSGVRDKAKVFTKKYGATDAKTPTNAAPKTQMEPAPNNATDTK